MTNRRCVISGCRELGEHFDDCASDRCKGCRPRAVVSGLVCTSDRIGLAAVVDDIGMLHAQLLEDPDPVEHREDWVWLPWPTSDPVRARPWRFHHAATAGVDVLARVLPAGIVASSLGAGARVSGSKEPAAPTDLDRLDLAGVARSANLTAAGRAAQDDQIGHHSVAAALDLWVRDWRDTLCPDQHLPVPSVPELVRWLGNRLSAACDGHPAVDDFATEMGDLRLALRRKLGLNAPPLEKCQGVQCRACDRMNTLYREGGLIQCKWCGLNYSERGYEEWVGLLNADTRLRLGAGQLEMPPVVPPVKRRDPGPKRWSLVWFPDWVKPQ